jgi:hypothetical protein
MMPLVQKVARRNAGLYLVSRRRDDDTLLKPVTPVIDSLYACYAEPNRNE